jgi:hypothetical protein
LFYLFSSLTFVAKVDNKRKPYENRNLQWQLSFDVSDDTGRISVVNFGQGEAFDKLLQVRVQLMCHSLSVFPGLVCGTFATVIIFSRGFQVGESYVFRSCQVKEAMPNTGLHLHPCQIVIPEVSCVSFNIHEFCICLTLYIADNLHTGHPFFRSTTIANETG